MKTFVLLTKKFLEFEEKRKIGEEWQGLIILLIFKMGQKEQEKINLEHKIQIKELQWPPEKVT